MKYQLFSDLGTVLVLFRICNPEAKSVLSINALSNMYNKFIISLIVSILLSYTSSAQMSNDSISGNSIEKKYKNQIGIRLPAGAAGSEFSLVYKRNITNSLALEANVGTLAYNKFYNAAFLLTRHLNLLKSKRLKLIYGAGGTLIFIKPEYMHYTRYYNGQNGPGRNYGGLSVMAGPEYQFRNRRFLIGLDFRKTYFDFIDYERGVRYKYNNIALIVKYML
ncbi:MAG: hypothetical protein ACO1NZ_11330 [Adhaeribacter sp.]